MHECSLFVQIGILIIVLFHTQPLYCKTPFKDNLLNFRKIRQSTVDFDSGSIMFHVRRRPADSQPRRRKKKPLGVQNGSNNVTVEREGPMLVEITHSGDGGRRVKLTAEPIEVRITIILSFSLKQWPRMK